MDPEARAVIDTLELSPHPEGGFFRETFRADSRIAQRDSDSPRRDAVRGASTAIYFLLPAGAFSAWHRVRSADEAWHFYDGDPLELLTIDPDGVARRQLLGRDLAKGERPQHVVPRGHWQAARTLGDRFTLCGCTVAPAFEFSDFEMPTREELVALFPQHKDIIDRFTRQK